MNLPLYKKLSKREFKLKSKPWINSEILSKIKKRDKLMREYCRTADKDSIASQTIYEEYKIVRNELTKTKR